MPLNEEQQKILDDIKEKHENHTQNPFIFIQGKAGTGKSFLIEAIQEYFNCNILVPTNLAKSVYKEGNNVSTIQSFFSGELDPLENECQDALNYRPKPANSKWMSMRESLEKADYLVVDEISMVRADLFEMMNKICQAARGSEKPFGGITIIAVGDMLQLPPIVPEVPEGEENVIQKYLQDTYGGVYFFNSKVIQENLNKIAFYELKISNRHAENPAYEKLLDVLREPKNGEDLRAALEKINTRVADSTQIFNAADDITTIVTTNSEVEKINANRLSRLDGEEQVSYAKFTIYNRANPQKSLSNFDERAIPAEYNPQEYYPIGVPSQFASVLKYKKGARVMFTKNFKKQKVYNGQFGFITGIIKGNWEDALLVRPEKQPDVTVVVKKETVTRWKISYDEKNKKIKAEHKIQETRQYPLKSGYAFTVHKSQGQTYDKVIIDLSDRGMFASGQLYVALSRARSLEGLFLTKRLTTSDCMVSLPLIGFLEQMRRKGSLPVLPAEVLAEEPLMDACRQFKDKIFGSKLSQATKDDIGVLLQHYNNAYRLGEYSFAAAETEKILDKVDGACADKELTALTEQIRQTLGKNPTQASCDSTLEKIGELVPQMTENNSSELIQKEHRTPVQQEDPPFIHRLDFERAGRDGFSYEKLFAQYLKGATKITLTETYLIQDYQFENLREFIDLLVKLKAPNKKMDLHLITLDVPLARREQRRWLSFNECKRRLENLREYCMDEGLTSFSWEFSHNTEEHDREILTDTGWSICSGRGLDIWQGNPYKEREKEQIDRRCLGGFKIWYYKKAATA